LDDCYFDSPEEMTWRAEKGVYYRIRAKMRLLMAPMCFMKVHCREHRAFI
jgi:hypothetical protein